MRDMRVREQGNVSDGIVADKEIIFGQVCLHDFQRRPTAVALRCEQRGFLWRVGLVLNPKSRSGDVRLVAVLLEEHPLAN